MFRSIRAEKTALALATPLPSDFTTELTSVYQKYFRKGFIYAILLHFLVMAVYGGITYYNAMKEDETRKNQQRIINVTLTDLEPPPSATDEEEPPPPKIEEKLITPTKDLESMQPEPVAKEKAEIQTIKTQKELDEIKTPVSTTGDTGSFQFSGKIKIDEKLESKIEKKETTEKSEKEKTVYQQFEVEKPPECVNLLQVKNSMRYPDLAKESGIEGRVTVKVLVGETGSVIKVGSVSGDPVFSDEVREKSMDLQFTPGLQNGKPVKVWVSVPFVFKLKDN
jgi:protein TonB